MKIAKTFLSKKAKGKRLELRVAQLIRQKLGIDAKRMPYSGASSFGSGDVFCPELPFHFELKNQERLRIWTEIQKIRDFKNPVLIFSGNNRPIWVAISIELFLKLIDEGGIARYRHS